MDVRAVPAPISATPSEELAGSGEASRMRWATGDPHHGVCGLELLKNGHRDRKGISRHRSRTINE